MVDIRSLKNPANDRQVREVITLGGGDTIKVYEPNVDDINKIIELQEKWINRDSGELQISGYDLLSTLFPMLTNLDGFDDLSDEELEDILNNPSNALIQTQSVIQTILVEVYKTVILRTREELTLRDFEVEAYKTSIESIERIATQATRENQQEYIEKITEYAEKLDELTENIDDLDDEQIEELKDDSKKLKELLAEDKKENKENKNENKKSDKKDEKEPLKQPSETKKEPESEVDLLLNNYREAFKDGGEDLL